MPVTISDEALTAAHISVLIRLERLTDRRIPIHYAVDPRGCSGDSPARQLRTCARTAFPVFLRDAMFPLQPLYPRDMPSIDLVALRRAVQENRYLMTTHAMRSMGLRKVSHEDIKKVMASGDVIEEHPDNLPDPKILLMTHIREAIALRFLRLRRALCYIVTVHWFDPTRWIDPWTRR
jgi:hypothetical protein